MVTGATIEAHQLKGGGGVRSGERGSRRGRGEMEERWHREIVLRHCEKVFGTRYDSQLRKWRSRSRLVEVLEKVFGTKYDS